MRTHHALFLNGDSPLTKVHLVAGMFRVLLRRMRQDEFEFNIPASAGLIPDSENEELDEFSRQLRQINSSTEGFVSEIVALANFERVRSNEKLRSLLLSIASFFKGLIRQDWEDVALFLTHINLITTSRESQQLVTCENGLSGLLLG